MNREQRRAYHKKIKNDSYAAICPKCNKLARFIAVARADFSGKCDIYCELCQRVVAEQVSGVAPRTYVKIKRRTNNE